MVNNKCSYFQKQKTTDGQIDGQAESKIIPKSPPPPKEIVCGGIINYIETWI